MRRSGEEVGVQIMDDSVPGSPLVQIIDDSTPENPFGIEKVVEDLRNWDMKTDI